MLFTSRQDEAVEHHTCCPLSTICCLVDGGRSALLRYQKLVFSGRLQGIYTCRPNIPVSLQSPESSSIMNNIFSRNQTDMTTVILYWTFEQDLISLYLNFNDSDVIIYESGLDHFWSIAYSQRKKSGHPIKYCVFNRFSNINLSNIYHQ